MVDNYCEAWGVKIDGVLYALYLSRSVCESELRLYQSKGRVEMIKLIEESKSND